MAMKLSIAKPRLARIRTPGTRFQGDIRASAAVAGKIIKGRSVLDILAKLPLSRWAGESHWLDGQRTRLRLIGRPSG